MAESINCPSCGAANQLPEGKKTMFCAFCGNSIERVNKRNELSENPLKVKPEISKKKIEPVSVFKPNYGNSYYEEKLSVTDEGGELTLINRGITSLNDIIFWFSDNELNEIRVLNLSNNEIDSLEGIQRFNSLELLDVSNNNIISLVLPNSTNDKFISINKINLSNNKIKSLNGISHFECRILDVSNNLITVLDDLPHNKQFDLVNLDNNPNLTSFSEEIKDRIYGICLALNGCLKFDYNNILEIIKRRKRINIWIWVKKGDTLPYELNNIGFEKNNQNEPIYDYYRYAGFNEAPENSNNQSQKIFSNFTTLNWIHIFSPLFLCFLLAFIGTKLEFTPINYWGCYGVGSFLVILLSFIRFMNYDTKTGRSFQTKYGRIDEYKTVHGNANVTSYFWFITLFHIIAVIICYKLANDFDARINLNNNEVSNTQSTVNSTSPSSNNNQSTSNFTEKDRAVAQEASKPLNQEAEEGELDDDYAYNHNPNGSSNNSGSNSNNNGFEIGSKYGAGIVAYIYQPGDARYIEGETHGIILAPEDGPETIWIEAFEFCETLIINGENGWELPNRDQLEAIAPNIQLLGGYKAGHNAIWSSNSSSANDAFACFFNYKSPISTYDKRKKLHVRAIKYF